MRKHIFMLLAAAVTALTATAITVDITPGTLAAAVGDDIEATALTVTGSMDARDFLFISNQMDELTQLDLSQASIVAYHGTALYSTIADYGINEIPRTAFFGKKLTSVVLPNSLTAIGYAAFAGCRQLTSVTIPASVTRIGDYAFAGSGLTSVSVPATVLDMGKGVFSRCESLVSATLDNAIIGNFAFLGDTRLADVNLGQGVTHVLEGVFNGCTALHSITIDEGSVLTHIGNEAFINSGLQTVDIQSAPIGTVGDWAFSQTPLVSATLPNGMTQLGEGAFAHDYELASVTLPGVGNAGGPNRIGSRTRRALERVNAYTFASDTLLAVGNVLRNGVTYVGDYAFYDNSQCVDTMRLPETVAYLGDSAMAGMTGMVTLKADALEPAALGVDVWAGVDQESVLLVTAADSKALYQAADQWMYFFFGGSDVLIGDVDGDGSLSPSDISALIDYLLNGTGDINLPNSDVDQDGEISPSDISALIDLMLNGSSIMSLDDLHHLVLHRNATIDVMTLQSISLRPGETRTIDVALVNTENDYVGFQGELILPQGVTLKAVSGIDRGNGHSYFSRQNKLDENVYTIIGMSMNLHTYGIATGNIMQLTVTASDDFGAAVADVEFTNLQLVTRRHQLFAAADAQAVVSTTGIDEISTGKSVAAVRYINVAGQQSSEPFEGINIVVTTYNDGSVSTAKVVK